MSEEQGSHPKDEKKKSGPSPLSIVLFPLFPVRLMFRWMYQDPNIRGELLGAVIVAGLVAISAVSGFIFGAAEDRRLDKELRIQTMTARYQTQLDALKAFSDAIPKNVTFISRQKGAQLALEAGPEASSDSRSSQELQALEQSLVQDWLETVDHYTSVCRGVRASFASQEGIEAVKNCELALDTFRRIDLNTELLKRNAGRIDELLGHATLPEDQRAEVEHAVENLRKYTSNAAMMDPPAVPGLRLDTRLSDEQRLALMQRAWAHRAAGQGLVATGTLTLSFYAETLDAVTAELREYDERLRPEDSRDVLGDVKGLVDTGDE